MRGATEFSAGAIPGNSDEEKRTSLSRTRTEEKFSGDLSIFKEWEIFW